MYTHALYSSTANKASNNPGSSTRSLKVQSAGHRRIERMVTSRNSQSKAGNDFPRRRQHMLAHAIEQMLVLSIWGRETRVCCGQKGFRWPDSVDEPGRGVSEMQKTVKTGMSPGDEKSYLAEYGGIVESLGRVDSCLGRAVEAEDALDFFLGGFVLVCPRPERLEIAFRIATTRLS
jgi:hypothetical protein